MYSKAAQLDLAESDLMAVIQAIRN